MDQAIYWHEALCDVVTQQDGFYHVIIGLILFMASFTACLSMHFIVNVSSSFDLTFLLYLIGIVSFSLGLYVVCGVRIQKAVSILLLAKVWL